METDLIGKVLGNRYEIIEKIGSGGMATVYKARCRVLNRFVAVKVLKEEFANDAEFIKRFQVEAQAAASLSHQNIVSIFDVGNDVGRHYIVMELIEGKTLKEIITEKGLLPWRDAVKIAAQIASGLTQAHKNHIVHRDIKPHNIIITKDGVAKVTDFGIAKAVSNSTINAHGMTMGSVHYFSPEQARGGYTDEKTDIYSLGVVLYEMTTGKVPFEADSPVSVALKHLQDTAEEPVNINKDIPESVNAIIMKAMQKEVANRYQTADAIYTNLKKVLKNPDEIVAAGVATDSFKTQRIPAVGASNTKDINFDKNNIEQDDGDMGRKKVVTKKRALVRFFIIIAIAIALFFGFVQVGKTLSNLILGGNTTVEVPNIVGYSEEEATKMLAEFGLKMEVTGRVISETYPIPGFITYQSYAEGYKLKAGDTVEVRVSKGTEKVLVPNVSESTSLREAKMKLENVGLVYKEVFESSESVPSGEIIRQDPEVNTEVDPGSEVNVIISIGDASVSGDMGLVKVPDMLGHTEEEARKLLDEANLIVSVKYTSISGKEDKTVLTQSIDGGAYVTELSTIEILINTIDGSVPENPDDKDDEKDPEENTPVQNKKRKVTIDLSTVGSYGSFNVKVVLEGNTIGKRVEYSGEHTRDDGKIEVEVADIKNAMLKVYVNDEVVSEMTL